jgi:protein-disulfide isomerase
MFMSSRTLLSLLAAAFLLLSGPALAKTSDEIKALKEEVAAMREGQEQMQKDLDEIKKLLQQGARPAAAPAAKAFEPRTIELGAISSRGEQDAPVTLIEYSDYDCPFCKRHAETVMPSLIENYVNTGKLRFVMREYPIDRLHPRAAAASEAVLCAGDQGQYWGMHDAMFADQKANTDEDFNRMAAGLGLDMDAFTACLGGDKFMEQIRSDIVEGQALGVSGTPSFVVGLTDPKDPNKVNVTKFIRGAQPLPAFQAAIDELLKTAEMAK